MTKKAAYLSIAAAATLWGLIGLFITYLYEIGFNPTQVVAIRALATAFFLGVYAVAKDHKLTQIKPADSKYFVGTGIVSIVLFNWCMFSAIQETSISVATILLYTAPAFVTVLSRFVFKEALTPRKVWALLITLTGCTLVVGLWPGSTQPVSGYGLLLGLGAGFFYALYSIFGKYALQKYHPITVTLYTFVFAAVAVTPFSGLWQVLPLFAKPETWLYITGLSLLSTTLAFLLYTNALNSIEASRAAIMATIEPVVASLVGLLVFREQLTIWQYTGIALVLAAVVIVQESAKKPHRTP